MDIIPEKWQNRWSSNQVIILVLASLGIQVGLIFLAPFRKRSSSAFIRLILWLLYLTADFVAILALGNISNQANPAESGDSGAIPDRLTVLWAPFLLLHLGGPDSITSYSLEDNELYWRHFMGLGVQVITTVYVFWTSPPQQWMWIPTMLVFFPGLVKFAERTQALRLGSRDYLKDKIMSEMSPANHTKKDGILSERIRNRKRESEDNSMDKRVSEHGAIPTNDTKDELTECERESQAICEGYVWIGIFKRLFFDVTLPSNLLMQSHDRFSDISARDALYLISIELSFLYDILHTKAVHMQYNFGRVLRCSSLVSIVAALVVFHHLDKQKYASKDIITTYILFDAGIILEVIAAMLLVSSDWTIVSLRKKEWRKCIAHSITKMVKRITLMKGKTRWSKTIGQYNLVGLCLRDRYTPHTWIMKKLFRLKHILDNMYESKLIPVSELLEDIMFNVAIRRAQNVHIYNVLREARSYRGGKVLQHYGQLKNLEWSMKREFDETIILWHVATDICYYNETSNQPKGNDDTERDVSWKISNYMVYLLIQEPSMIMQLEYGKTQFDAICAVVKKKFGKFNGDGKLDHKKSCAVLMQNEVAALVSDDSCQPGWRCWGRHKGEEDNPTVEDEMGELVLKNCRRLAKELLEIEPEIKKWQLISETWMEMLGYAAIHCDSYQHANTLRRGGELLTHLWLLMAQLGVVEEHKMQQFQSASV